VVLHLSLAESLAVLAAALLPTVVLLWLLLRWRHALAMRSARRVAARLRVPATTLAVVEAQAAAVEELCLLRDVEAAAVAARELLGERDEAIRSAAIEILRRTRALELWARDLRTGGRRAKIAAVRALGEIGDERAVEELIRALGDDDPAVARAASRAVVARGRGLAGERLAEALSAPSRRIAEAAAGTLMRLGGEAEECLVGQLGSLSAQARRLAVECLATAGSSPSTAVLAPLLDTDPAPEVRVAVVEAMARMGGEEAWSRLGQVFRFDRDWLVRARTASLLAEANAPGAAELLLAALSDLESEVSWGAADGGNVGGGARVRSAIISGLRSLGVREERIAAAERARTEEGGPLQRALVARDPVQRLEAVKQLAEAGRKASALLQAALCDPEPLVRGEAARALGRVGGGDSLGPLAACLQDPNTDVRLAASNALRAIVMREAFRELPAGESEGLRGGPPGGSAASLGGPSGEQG